MTCRRVLVITTLSVALAGCGAGHHPANSSRIGPASATALDLPAGRAGDVLSSSDIRATAAANAYDAIQRLRPRLLSRRGTPTPSDPLGGFAAVYQEQQYLGGLETLQGIPASMVHEVRYLSPSAAQHLIGTYHAGGVILVVRKRSTPVTERP